MNRINVSYVDSVYFRGGSESDAMSAIETKSVKSELS